MHRVSLRENSAYYSMAGFVVGDSLTLFVGEDDSFPLDSSKNAIDRFLKIEHLNLTFAMTSSEQCCFVGQVFQICSDESGSASRHDDQINIRCKPLACYFETQDRLSPCKIRTRYGYLTIEPAGSKECGVENIRAISRC